MRGRTLILATAGALLLSVPAPASALQGTECEGAETPITKAKAARAERILLCLVNVHRAANGRAPLTHHASLIEAAGSHSEFMEAHAVFAHEGIGDGTAQSRATAAGYPFAVGENIHYSAFPSFAPADILAAFVASPAHNANILDPLPPTGGERIVYRTAGMGLAVGPTYGVTTTQMFGVDAAGATDTAADLLTSPGCESATARIAKAERAVGKAKRKLRRADTAQERKQAKKALRKAKKALRAATAAEQTQCTLTY